MKKMAMMIMDLALCCGAVLFCVSGVGYAGGIEDLRAVSGQETMAIIEAGIPEPQKAADGGSLYGKAGVAPVSLYIRMGGELAVSGSASFAARKDSHFCTEFSWNEGSMTRVPKRTYPEFKPQHGLLSIPDSIPSSCDYGREGGISLSFSVPGRAEAYSSVAVLEGGGGPAEQEVACSIISAGPSGGAKEMLNCNGTVRLDASGQAKVRVLMAKEAAVKSTAECPAGCGIPDPLDISNDKLVEFGSVCELGKNPADAVANATLLMNQPVIRLQTNINVWTYTSYTGAYIQAPYKAIGEAAVSKISGLAKYNWLACIPVQGRIR